MKNIKSIIVVAALGITSTATGQNLNSGYFNDGYLYRHELNPVYGNEQNYVAFPILGNFNLNFNSSLKVSDLLYNVNGRTALFLNPKVDANEFLKNIKDDNRIAENLKLQVFGAGFKAWGGYNTIELNVHQNLYLDLPGDLFRLAKNGLENKVYDLSNLDARANAYGEISLGHSRQINDKLRVGAKVNVLVGVARANVELENMTANLAGEEWEISGNAKAEVMMKGFQYVTEKKEYKSKPGEYYNQVTDFDIDGVGIGGFGHSVHTDLRRRSTGN